MAGNRRWTKEEDQLLKELLKEGATRPEIAEELGRTPRAIENRAGRVLKIPGQNGHPTNPFRRALILSLLADGRSLNEIAKILRVNSSTICRTVWRMEKDKLVARAGDATRRVKFLPRSYRDGDEPLPFFPKSRTA
jgi:DNA-binding NarL/FixJ family response regulator